MRTPESVNLETSKTAAFRQRWHLCCQREAILANRAFSFVWKKSPANMADERGSLRNWNMGLETIMQAFREIEAQYLSVYEAGERVAA